MAPTFIHHSFNFNLFFFFFNPHSKLLLLEREGGREGEKPDWLPPVHALTGDRTCILLVYGMMLQPTKPPSQGSFQHFNFPKNETTVGAGGRVRVECRDCSLGCNQWTGMQVNGMRCPETWVVVHVLQGAAK